MPKFIQANSRVFHFDTLAKMRAMPGEGLVEGDIAVFTGEQDGDNTERMYLWNTTSTGTDNSDTVIKLTDTTTGRFRAMPHPKEVYATNYEGVDPTGATDSAAGIQAALDSLTSGGDLIFPKGTYAVGRQTGTEQTGPASANDYVTERWGIKITNSNVRLVFEKGAKLKRFNTPSGTWSDPNGAADAASPSYAILHIGETESNDAGDQVTDIEIVGGHFEGNDIRHSASTSAIVDHNTAIFIRNADRVKIDGAKFTKVDSSAIFTWLPGSLVNTTQVKNLDIINCEAIGVSHTTSERALMHCFWITADYWSVVNCKFEWVDNGVGVDSTYFNFSDSGNWTETTNSLGSVPRSGRGGQIIGCHFENCSEHGIYAETVDLIVSNNTFVGLSQYVANDAKLRVRGATCIGNNFFNRKRAWALTEACGELSVQGGVVRLTQTDSIGINIDNQDIETWITNRSEWAPNAVSVTATTISATASGNTIDDSASGFGSFAVGDIVSVTGFTGTAANNDIYRVTAASAASLTLEGNTLVDDAAGESVTVIADALPVMRNIHVDGVSFYCEADLTGSVQDFGVNLNSDPSAPTNYFLGYTTKEVTISNCQFFGFREGVHINGDHIIGINFDGNEFHGPKFLENNFNLDTTLGGVAVIGIHNNTADCLSSINFTDNYCRGWQNLFHQTDGAQAAAGTFSIPSCKDNKLHYIHTLFGHRDLINDGVGATLTNATNLITQSGGTNLNDDDFFRFSGGTLPSELDNEHWYVVDAASGADFQAKYLLNDAVGKVITFTSDGSGVTIDSHDGSLFVRPDPTDQSSRFSGNIGINVFDFNRERALNNVLSRSGGGDEQKMGNIRVISDTDIRLYTDNQGTYRSL